MTSAFVLMMLVSRGWGGTPQAGPDNQSSLTHMSLEDLGKIEVTSTSKEPVQASQTPAAIYVITQEDIRRSGATSIPEVLRLAPGVEVARIDSNTWSLGVRGFGSSLSRSVLVLIDGRTVYTPLFAGVWWNVQDTMLEDIERIEVIRGPGGTIWGANAVNAVINIITKNAKETRGALVSAGGGVLDQGFLNVRYGGGDGKSFDYRIYGKGFRRGPEFHSDHRQYDDWGMGQGGFRMDWDLPSKDALTLQGDIYKGEAGEQAVITTFTPPFTNVVQDNAQLSGGNLLGRWKRTLSAGSDLQLETYYDRTDRRQSTFGEIRDTFDIDFIHHLTFVRQNFLWGAGARISSGNAIEVVPTTVFTPNHFTEKLYSAFVQDEIAIIEKRLLLTLGSKLLHNNYSGFDVEPSARILWTPVPHHTVWAAVTRAVRTPSRVEEDLQITGFVAPNPLTFLRVVGNRKFRSEELLGYELGYRSLIHPKFYVDIASFYNNYDRLLSGEPGSPFVESSPSPPHIVIPFIFGNGLAGNTSGFEIAPDWTPTSHWRLRGSYSYLHIGLSRNPGSLDASTIRSTDGSSPHHMVTFQSSLDLPQHFEFDQTLRYVSALPAQKVSAYTTADAQFSWHSTRDFDFAVVGQNLLQSHHAEFASAGPLVGIERSAYVKVTWHTGKR
ncbi:MAG TPA: TonB-dependent receptor [Terriglobales bacterium]|nr:TonB-dependent receptor [Terriglobales bacterium]